MTDPDDKSTPAVPPVPPAPGASSEHDGVAAPAASPYSAPPAFPSAPPAYGTAPTGQPNPYANPSGQSNPYAVNGASTAPRGLSIASMVTGIASVVFAFFWFGFLPGIAAVILGHLAQRRQPEARPFWLTGIITGYVGILIGLIQGAFILFILIAAFSSGSGYNEFS